MAAGDHDSFIREVNEDIRQERIGRLWRLLKPYIIGGALAIILLTIAAELYSSYKTRKAQALGDSYSAALQLAEAGPSAEAFAQLAEIEKSNFGGYPMLAELRKASALAQNGDKAAALKAFDAFAANEKFPKIWREMAAVRAAYIVVDIGSFADVEQRVKPFANDVDPMRMAVREALGLAAWKAGRLGEAAAYFNRNYSDKDSVNYGFGDRAAMMMSLIGSESENQSAPHEGEKPAAGAAKGASSAPAFKQGQ